MNECQAQCATRSAATRSVAQRAHATHARRAHKHNSARATEHSPHYVFTLCTALTCVLSRAVLSRLHLPPTTYPSPGVSALSPFLYSVVQGRGVWCVHASPRDNRRAKFPTREKGRRPHASHHTTPRACSARTARTHSRRTRVTRYRASSLLGSHPKEACE